MDLEAVTLYRYDLPLIRPLYVRGHSVFQRRGLLLRLVAGGREGWGECAPLEGCSHESLDQALDQFRHLQQNLLYTSIPADLSSFNGAAQRWLAPFDLAPSVRFAMESAALNLDASLKGCPLASLFGGQDDTGGLPLDGLLEGEVAQVCEQAQAMKLEGIKSFKLKVRGDPQPAAAKVQALNAVLAGEALLHVDANQCWSLEQAVQFGTQVGCAGLSYIEEPLANIQEIPLFFEKTYIPVAIDETLINSAPEALPRVEGLDVFILKPTLLGGLERAWQWGAIARDNAIEGVISASFESGVGLSTLIHFAKAMPACRHAGLDTLKFFEEDLLQEPLKIDQGKIYAPQHPLTAQDLRLDLLEEVYS